MKTRLTILGSTGSIGESTLDVVSRNLDRYQVYALSAHTNVNKLVQQCVHFQPQFAVIKDAHLAEQVREQLRLQHCATQVLIGESGLIEIARAPDVDTVVAAIVGAAGLTSTFAAAQAGKRILLANKEALVMSGQVFMEAVKKHGAELLPIDSEHNAIFQCWPCDQDALTQISKIILTASGGPLLQRDPETLWRVTPDEACRHPNWSMGRKISVDSATMMNKGLEVIEAHWIFGLPAEQIDVLIHPQSVIHSLVAYKDGSVLAELGYPDMRTPIAYGLAYPDRIESGVEVLDLSKLTQLHFEEPNYQRFPCLSLAIAALKAGGASSVVLNAANEIAVDAFLTEQIGFMDIASIVASTLEKIMTTSVESIEAILAVDHEARIFARSQVTRVLQKN